MTETELRDAVVTSLLDLAPEASPEDIDPAVPVQDQLDIDSMDYLDLLLALARRRGSRSPRVITHRCPRSTTACATSRSTGPARRPEGDSALVAQGRSSASARTRSVDDTTPTGCSDSGSTTTRCVTRCSAMV